MSNDDNAPMMLGIVLLASMVTWTAAALALAIWWLA